MWPGKDIAVALTDIDDPLCSVQQWKCDTRLLNLGDGFIAFRGKKTDGHNYLNQAVECGAVLAIVERYTSAPIKQIKVNKAKDALWRLADYARKKHTTTHFIGITGSVGKSSTRSLMSQAFSALCSVYSSTGNFNNSLGMPICLANMGIMSSPKIAIFELGMNHADEIAPMSHLLSPNVALVLNVAPVHIGNFSNLKAVARAKAEIYSGLSLKDYALIPEGIFSRIMRQNVNAQIIPILGNKSAYIWDNDNMLHCRPLQQSFSFLEDKNLQRFKSNILAVMETAGVLFGHKSEYIITMLKAIENWQPEIGRGHQVDLNLPDGGIVTLIDDSYNASTLSIQALIDQVNSWKRTYLQSKKILILGEIYEMGQYESTIHAEITKSAWRSDCDVICLVGKAFRSYLLSSNRMLWFNNAIEVEQVLWPQLNHGDLIAIKGSRLVGLDIIFKRWQNRVQKNM